MWCYGRTFLIVISGIDLHRLESLCHKVKTTSTKQMPYYWNTSPGPLVILMRHGRTKANEGGTPLIRAWKDYPLDEAKKGQITATAEELKAYGIKEAFSSDLMRDTETAQIVVGILGIHSDTDFDARTWDMGTFEGRPLEEVNPAIEQLYKKPWELPPGSSESFNDFSMRWQKFLDRKMYLAANVAAMRPVLIVTHGKNIALTESYIDGILPETAEMPLPAGYAVISVNEDRSLNLEMKGKTEPVIEDI